MGKGTGGGGSSRPNNCSKRGASTSSSGGRGDGGWSAAEHTARIDAKLMSLAKKCKRRNVDVSDTLARGYKRSNLAHDSQDKIESAKLRLVIAKTRKEVESLRERLRCWDPVEEERARKEEEEKKRKTAEEAEGPKKKKRRGRLGPETWKLRGAARPAHEVYNFDTRYVDPHLEAHKAAKEKARRVVNVLSVYRGKFCLEGEEGPPRPHGRRYLSLLMQLGLINVEARKYKSARAAFLEVMELEGCDTPTPVTNARCRLMRMCLEANRPDSARKLWEKLPNDESAWVRYSAALLEYVSWKLLGEKGSTRLTAEALLLQAVRCNVFCAYHLAYHNTFRTVMEYAEDVEDADGGTLEEAVEYCGSEMLGHWVGTEGAVQWLRDSLLRSMNEGEGRDGRGLTAQDLDWSGKLAKIEDVHEADRKEKDGANGGEKTKRRGSGCEQDEEEEESPDVLMYAGMFRTAMDMLQDEGEFLRIPPPHQDDDEKEEKVATETMRDYNERGSEAASTALSSSGNDE